jgi:hypothetical protein
MALGYMDLESALEEADSARGIIARMKKINLPGKDSDEYNEYIAKTRAAEKKFAEKQALTKIKKVTDAVEGFKAFEDYGNDLTKFPGGPDGPLANKARASMFRYGSAAADLPGEGSAFQKLKRLYEGGQNPNKGIVKFNPKGATIDVGSEVVRPKATGLGKAVGAFSKVAGGLVKGLAQAPAYEFVNPPSAGPSDPEDPVYQFERGLISEEEFLRKMSK